MKIKTGLKIVIAASLATLSIAMATSFIAGKYVREMAREEKSFSRILENINGLRALTYDFLMYRTDRARNQWLLIHNDIERFLAALARAEEFARQKGDDAKAIVGSTYNFDSAYLNHVWWSRTKYELSLDQALLLAMEDEARWMIKNGMSYGHKQIPDYLHHIYSDPLLRASPKSVRLIAVGKGESN